MEKQADHDISDMDTRAGYWGLCKRYCANNRQQQIEQAQSWQYYVQTLHLSLSER